MVTMRERGRFSKTLYFIRTFPKSPFIRMQPLAAQGAPHRERSLWWGDPA
jgi:hypothetical protein